jgi:hypothetical protein
MISLPSVNEIVAGIGMRAGTGVMLTAPRAQIASNESVSDSRVGRRKRLPHVDELIFTFWWGRRFRLPSDCRRKCRMILACSSHVAADFSGLSSSKQLSCCSIHSPNVLCSQSFNTKRGYRE